MYYKISEAIYDPKIDNCHEKTIAEFVHLKDAERFFEDNTPIRAIYLWFDPCMFNADTSEMAWSHLYRQEYSKIHD